MLSHDVQTNTLIGDFTFEGTEVLFIDSHPSLPSQSMAGASCGKLITIDQRIGQNGGGTGRAPHSTTVVRDDCIYSSFRLVRIQTIFTKTFDFIFYYASELLVF